MCFATSGLGKQHPSSRAYVPLCTGRDYSVPGTLPPVNEICAPPAWAKRAIANREPDASAESLLATVMAALRVELTAILGQVEFAVRDDGANIIVTWVGGPEAQEVGSRLSFECIRETRDVLLLEVMCFESPEWQAAIDMLTVVLRGMPRTSRTEVPFSFAYARSKRHSRSCAILPPVVCRHGLLGGCSSRLRTWGT